VPDVPQFVLDRLRAKEPVFTADEVACWPDGLLDQLLAEGVLHPAENAKSVVCDACGRGHVEEVIFIESPPGSGVRAYITCPEAGRVRIDLNRLRQWAVNQSTLESILAPPGPQGSADKPRFVFRRIGELWLVRFEDEQGSFKPIAGLVYLAHLLGSPCCRTSAQDLKKLTADVGAEPTGRILRADSQEVLDDQVSVTQGTTQEAADAMTIRECNRRLSEIGDERESVRQTGDIEKLDDLEEEEKKIKDYLSGVKNIRGGSRSLADPQRSMFNSIKQAIDRAVKKFAAAAPPLSRLHEHISKSLDSGNGAFEYRPAEPSPAWEL
jgi:hypothetical protein